MKTTCPFPLRGSWWGKRRVLEVLCTFWNLSSLVIFSCGRKGSLSHTRFQILSQIVFYLKSFFIWNRFLSEIVFIWNRFLSKIGYGAHSRLSPYRRPGIPRSRWTILRLHFEVIPHSTQPWIWASSNTREDHRSVSQWAPEKVKVAVVHQTEIQMLWTGKSLQLFLH